LWFGFSHITNSPGEGFRIAKYVWY
jgi:hypothetical protein